MNEDNKEKSNVNWDNVGQTEQNIEFNHNITQKIENDNMEKIGFISFLKILYDGYQEHITPLLENHAHFVVLKNPSNGKGMHPHFIPIEVNEKWMKEAEEFAQKHASTHNIFYMMDLTNYQRVYQEWEEKNPEKAKQGKTCTNRGSEQHTVLIPCLWLDLDYQKDGHHKQNDLYFENRDKVIEFLQDIGLTPTLVVDSGGGIHAYFKFEKPLLVSQEKGKTWEDLKNLSLKFQSYVIKQASKVGKKVDNTHDLTRILRLPETFNLKNNGKKEVQVLYYNSQTLYQEDFFHSLDVENEGFMPKSQIKESEPSEEEEVKFPESNFFKATQQCPFLSKAYEKRESLPNDVWYSQLSIAVHCVGNEGEDGVEIGHLVSSDYKEYSYEETQRTLERLSQFGPRTCEKIEQLHGHDMDFGVCGTCPHRGKITTPCQLGIMTSVEKARLKLEKAFERSEKRGWNEEVVTEPEIIGALAVLSQKDQHSYDIFKERYQETFKIGEKKLKNMMASLKGDSMGKVIEHPSQSEERKNRVLSLLNINEEEILFYVWEGNGEQRYPERISNFIMTPLYSLKDYDGNYLYSVKIESKRHQEIVTIDPKSLTSNADFKKFCRQKGEFIWTGKPKHLDWLNEYLINHETPTVLYIDYIGYHREYECWIFPTHAFIHGQTYHADENGLIHAEGKIFKVMDNAMFKLVRPLVTKEPSQEEILNYFQNLYTIYGNYGVLGIGWVVAGFQVHMFEQKMDTPQFPFLYATGIFQSGKTQFMRRMFELAGLKGKFDNNPTRDIWRKSVKAYSSLPLNFDEVRDTGKNGFFNQMREVINKTFDRDEHKRGSIDPNAPYVYPTQAVVGFSGEVPTEDSAIMSRTVFVHSIHFTKNTKAFNRLARAGNVANWMGQYLQRTSHEWKEIIFNAFISALKDMEEFEIDSRELTNYALCVAGATLFLAIFRIPNQEEILKHLLQFIREIGEVGQKETKESHPCIQYLTKLGVLASSSFPKLEKDEHYLILEEDIDGDGVKESLLYLSPEACWQVFQQNVKDYDAFYNSSRKIKNDLESFKFFVGIQEKRIGKSKPRAWKINLNHPDLPIAIKNYFAPDEDEEEENEAF